MNFTTEVKTLNIAATATESMNQLEKGDAVQSMALLPEDFVPGDDDVICGRGRNCFNHNGNERFRRIVTGYLEQYSKSSSKMEKSYILSDIVAKVRKSSPNGGGFVKKCPETKRFYEVGCFLAREKTSQAFRDALHDQYKSSNSAKKKRRQVSQAVKLQKSYSASNIGYDASAEPLDAEYTPSSKKFMRVDRPGDLLQKAYSASNLGYDAAAEPLDAYPPSKKFMRTDKPPRTSRFELQKAYSTSNLGYDAEPLDADPLNLSIDFTKAPVRRGLSSQNMGGGSSRSVLEFNRSPGTEVVKVGAWFNRSCPNLTVDKSYEEVSGPIFDNKSQDDGLGFKTKSYEESGGSQPVTCEWESGPKPFSVEYQSSSRIAHNPFLESKTYFSRSSQSLMSVEESIAEDEEFGGFKEPVLFEERELTMENLLLKASDAPAGGDLLASLSKLIHDVDLESDPFEPVPLPMM
jgi:hypothetical protein